MHSWGPQWGPLQLQAAAAAKGVQQGSMLRQHDGRTLIVCPEAAAELLRLHDGGEGVGLCKITNRDRRELLGQALVSGVHQVLELLSYLCYLVPGCAACDVPVVGPTLGFGAGSRRFTLLALGQSCRVMGVLQNPY